MSKAPEVCAYCHGTGYVLSDDGFVREHECGFCDNGKPLDTQEDWDRTWGRIGVSEGSDADDGV